MGPESPLSPQDLASEAGLRLQMAKEEVKREVSPSPPPSQNSLPQHMFKSQKSLVKVLQFNH